MTGQGEGERREIGKARSVVVEQMEISDLDSFMRRVLSEATPAQPLARTLLRRDYETALNLLQRASDAVPILMQQCLALEQEVRDLRAQSEADLGAANKVTDQWHQLALALKAKIEESDTVIAGLQQRVDAAEKRLTEDRQHADAVQQQATTAFGIATLFHDRIVEAFGVGSQAHAAMDLVAKGGIDPRARPEEPPDGRVAD